jgi:hypothetical protein
MPAAFSRVVCRFEATPGKNWLSQGEIAGLLGTQTKIF